MAVAQEITPTGREASGDGVVRLVGGDVGLARTDRVADEFAQEFAFGDAALEPDSARGLGKGVAARRSGFGLKLAAKLELSPNGRYSSAVFLASDY